MNRLNSLLKRLNFYSPLIMTITTIVIAFFTYLTWQSSRMHKEVLDINRSKYRITIKPILAYATFEENNVIIRNHGRGSAFGVEFSHNEDFSSVIDKKIIELGSSIVNISGEVLVHETIEFPYKIKGKDIWARYTDLDGNEYIELLTRFELKGMARIQ